MSEERNSQSGKNSQLLPKVRELLTSNRADREEYVKALESMNTNIYPQYLKYEKRDQYYEYKGQLYLELEYYSDAISTFTEWKDIVVKKCKDYQETGIDADGVQIDAKNVLADAVDIKEKKIKKMREIQIKILLYLAKCEMKQKNYDKALEYIQEADNILIKNKIDPTLEMLLDMGKINLELAKREPENIELLKNAEIYTKRTIENINTQTLSLSKKTDILNQANIQMGDIKLMQKKPKDASNFFRDALKTNPSSSEASRGEYLADIMFLEEKQKKGTEEIEENLKKIYWEIYWGMIIVAGMYILLFIVGLGLLLWGIIFAAFGNNRLELLFLTGGVGASLLVAFLWKSPMSLQKNRVDLSQWLIAYYNWLSTIFTFQTIIRSRNEQGNLTDTQEIINIYKFLGDVTTATINEMEASCESGNDRQILSIFDKKTDIPQ